MKHGTERDRVLNAPSERATAPPGGFNYLFVLSWVVLLVILVIKFPSHGWRAEPWAETGPNYLSHALHDGLWTNLWTTDAGYVTWLPRLIAVLVGKGPWPVEFFIYGVQFCALALVAFFGSVLNLRPFRALIASDGVRFILGFALVLVDQYDLYSLINIAYFGLVFALLACFLPKEKLSRSSWILITALVFLLGASKAHSILLFPLVLGLLVYGVLKKRRRDVIMGSGGAVATMIQTVVLLVNRRNWSGSTVPGEGLDPLEAVANACYFTVNGFKRVFFGPGYPETLPAGAEVAVGVAILAAVAGLMVGLWKRREGRPLWFVLTAYALAVGGFLLNAVAIKANAGVAVDWTRYLDVGLGRVVYGSMAGLFLGTVVMINAVLRGWRIFDRAIGLAVNLYFSAQFSLLSFLVFQDYYLDPAESWSNWTAFRQVLRQESYFLPVNPPWWAAQRHCYPLNMTYLCPLSPGRLEANQILPPSAHMRVRGILLSEPRTRFSGPLVVTAVSAEGAPIAEARLLGPLNRKCAYYVFDEPVSPAAFEFRRPDGAVVKRLPHLQFIGVSNFLLSYQSQTGDPTEVIGEVLPGMEVVQTFVCPHEQLAGVALFLVPLGRRNRCTVRIVVRDETLRRDIQTATCETSHLPGNTNFKVLFDQPVFNVLDHAFSIRVSSDDARPGQAIFLALSPEADPASRLTVAGRPVQGSIVFQTIEGVPTPWRPDAHGSSRR